MLKNEWEQKICIILFISWVRRIQCDKIWRNSVKLAKKLKVYGTFDKVLAFLWHIFMRFGKLLNKPSDHTDPTPSCDFYWINRAHMLGPTSAAVSMTLDARCPLARWRPSSGFRTGECTQPCTAHVMKGENINQWTTASFDFHQMAVHKRTTMLVHCNLKQNTWLCSKQSSFFSFYVLPSGGKSKDAVVHWLHQCDLNRFGFHRH